MNFNVVNFYLYSVDKLNQDDIVETIMNAIITNKFDENSTEIQTIILFGYKVSIYPNEKIEIFNDMDIPIYDFKSTSNRLIQYLIDESFIEKKRWRVEIVSPVSDDEKA